MSEVSTSSPAWAEWAADADRPAFTLGVEEEVMLLDPVAWGLAHRIDTVLPRIPADVAQSYGLSGANLRGSGVDFDLRRDSPSGMVHPELDWTVHTHPDGDCFSRWWVRIQEIR